jgi:hypothetical protein
LNGLEADDRSAPDFDHVEHVRRSISSMVPAAVDLDRSLRLYFLAIFRGNLHGECDNSRDDSDSRAGNCRGGEWDQPDI